MRVLKWIVDRVRGRVAAIKSPIGWVPGYEDIEWNGLGFTREQFAQVMAFDHEAWTKEVADQEEFFLTLRDRLPKELVDERAALIGRL
jgi:phosphoenolpyruvate carboxykinase (GTP)